MENKEIYTLINVLNGTFQRPAGQNADENEDTCSAPVQVDYEFHKSDSKKGIIEQFQQ